MYNVAIGHASAAQDKSAQYSIVCTKEQHQVLEWLIITES